MSKVKNKYVNLHIPFIPFVTHHEKTPISLLFYHTTVGRSLFTGQKHTLPEYSDGRGAPFQHRKNSDTR